MENEKIVEMIQSGHKEYYELLYIKNKALIYTVIRRCGIKKEDTEDALQDGYIGLHQAAEYFKRDNNTSFATYAYTLIKHSVLKGRHTGNIFYVPENEYYTLYRIQEVRRSFRAENKTEPSTEILSELCGLSAARIKNLLSAAAPVKSLNAPYEGSDGVISEFGDIISDNAPPVSELEETNELKRLIRRVLNTLTAPERQTILYRYIHDKTEKDTAVLLHIPTNEVRRLEETALRKLKHYKNRVLLEAYI